MTEKSTTDAVIDAALGWRARAARGDDPRLWADAQDFALIEAVDELLAERATAVQNLLDDATKAFADADTSSERVEVIRDLLAGWYAAWPSSAITDPHEGIAWQLASLINAAEARAAGLTSCNCAPAVPADVMVPLAGWGGGHSRVPARPPHAQDDREPGGTEHPPAEMVWLGDLSGYQLDADAGQVLVRHRCGWTYEVDNPVIAYLANLIDGPVAAHRDAGCNPHEG